MKKVYKQSTAVDAMPYLVRYSNIQSNKHPSRLFLANDDWRLSPNTIIILHTF